MKTEIPPLQALVAFEALSRHLNFSRAAQELSVTPGAVTRQIKALEEALGATLFERSPRGVSLTSTGVRYLADVRKPLQQLARATRELRGAPGQSLSINVLPSFATRWLIPRLPAFIGRHPDVDLRITATQSITAPGNGGPDLCIRYGSGPWPDAQQLARERLYPVCSPQMLDRLGHAPDKLPPQVPLLRDEHEPWEEWLTRAGEPANGHKLGARFDDSALLLQAAEAGHGIALARHLLAHDAVTHHRLVRIGSVDVLSRHSYFLATAPESQLPSAAQVFIEWVRAEMSLAQPQ